MTSEAPKLAPFNPTSGEAISVALRLLQPHAGDVIYDVGCGDGRFMTALAANSDGVRCVGVEYDPLHAGRAAQRLNAADAVQAIGDYRQESPSRLLLVEGDASKLSLVAPTPVAACGRLLSDTRLTRAQAAVCYAWSVKAVGVRGEEAGVRHALVAHTQADGTHTGHGQDATAASVLVHSLPAPATGVFCYLVPSGLALVEPMLREALEGGARVVTNMFQVPGWAERGWLRQKVVTKEGLPVYLYSLAG